MGLRILLSFFLLIKLVVLSLSVNVSPKFNPFTVDLESIIGESRFKTAPSKKITKLPAPDITSTEKPEISENELKQSLLHSKGMAEQLEKYKSSRNKDLDSISISSASTFDYEFEKPGSEKKDASEITRSDPKDKKINEFLEDAMKDLNSEQKLTLIEIEKNRPYSEPPDPPTQSEDENMEAETHKPEKIPFLTGIHLIDDVIYSSEHENVLESESEQRKKNPNISPITSSHSGHSGKFTGKKVQNHQITAQKTTIGTPPYKKTQEQKKIEKEKRKARFDFKKILCPSFFKLSKNKKQPESKKTVIISRPIMASTVKQTEDKQVEKKDVTEQTNGTKDFTKKTSAPLNVLDSDKQNYKQASDKLSSSSQTSRTKTPEQNSKRVSDKVFPSSESNRTKSPKQTKTDTKSTKKTTISSKFVGSDQEQSSKQVPGKSSSSSQTNKTEITEQNKITTTPTKRKIIFSKIVDSDQEQNYKQNSGRITQIPKSSEDQFTTLTNISDSETESLLPISGICDKGKKNKNRLPSIGSDNVFYDSDCYQDKVITFGDSEESDKISNFKFDEISPSSSEPSIYSADLHSNFESSLSRSQIPTKDPLDKINIGISKLDESQRVYEEFVPSKNLEVLQNKLINTYNSDDDLVENSIFDKVKNKIKRKRKKAERKKERSKGIPSRVITKKDVDRFGDFRPIESQPEKKISISPKINEIKKPVKPTLNNDVKESVSTKESKAEIEDIESDYESKQANQESQESIKKIIEKYRDIEIKKNEVESDPKSLENFQERTEHEYKPLQNSLEALTYNDELKEMKYARDDYFRNKFLQDLAEKTKKEENDKLYSQIAEKEALLQELEKISNELDKKKNQFIVKERSLIDEESTLKDENLEENESEKQDSLKKKPGGKDESTETDIKEEEETIYPEESLKLDEDAIIMGAERKETNKGIVVLDPENLNYEVYFDDTTDQDEDGLIPIKEYYNEEGLMPIQQTDKLSESEGLAPIGGSSKLKELQAFEEQDRSLLPPPEESKIPFEEIYLTKHPELLNTDAINTVSREKAIKKAFGDKLRKGGALRKREFENFNLSNEAIDRLKR